MRSTGEVMGVGRAFFAEAFAKAQLGSDFHHEETARSCVAFRARRR